MSSHVVASKPRRAAALALASALIAAFSMSPQQARADNAEVAVAVMLGAAMIYAAHESEPRYPHPHRHHAHCGHRAPGGGYYHSGYRQGYRDGHRYDDHHGYHQRPYYGAEQHHWRDKHHVKGHRKAAKHQYQYREERHGHSRAGKHWREGKQAHQAWNTRVRIRDY
ncbi:hypothetical protein [Spongiibacter sp.]|uniref:hypothetical protein n=1 Tax=Spongiibacter sp. TaxID=2024860 RepID=UPI0035677850